jgi:hypothetical protein
MIEVSVAVVKRLEAPIEAFALARLEALVEGAKVFDLRISRFGESVAPAAPCAPDLDFVNRIHLSPHDYGQVEQMLDYYRDLGLRPWLEALPDVELTLPASAELLGSQAVLYGAADAGERAGPTVRETDDADTTARLLLRAFGVPTTIVETDAPPLAVAAARCAGRFYIVDLDRSAAAAAILTVTERVGYLAMAATLPEFRGRLPNGANQRPRSRSRRSRL